MGRKKILHIITRLDAGGSATNTIETVTRLDKTRYEVFLISGRSYDPDGRIARELKDRGIDCVFIDDLRRDINLWHDIKAFVRLYRIIAMGGYDLVHTHSSKAGILGRWAAWLAGVKRIVHTPHGHIFYGYFNRPLTLFFILLERATALITDRIICLTDIGVEDHLRFKVAGKQKFVTIYSGIDINLFRQSCPQDIDKLKEGLGIDRDDFVFGTVTRLEPVKGNRFLISAFARILSKFQDLKLLIIGDGSQRSALEKQCQEFGISEHVVFAGIREDIPSLLYIMDVFILPSLNEGMGRAVIEAMACGRPVIASATGGLPELLRDGIDGVLVPPADVQRLAEAMKEFVSNPDKVKIMGESARQRAGDRFSIERMIEDVEKLYDSCFSVEGGIG